MEVVFLDANILFSAAWKEENNLLRLWGNETISLISSVYAVEEAERNLHQPFQKRILKKLLMSVSISSFQQDILPEDFVLRAKDRPILSSAIHLNADILLTGDIRDFGIYFERTVLGVTILPPALYL